MKYHWIVSVRVRKQTPPRLPQVFQFHAEPLFFLTFCTLHRRPILARASVAEAIDRYGQIGEATGKAAIGRFVIMPDHLHLFVRIGPAMRLGIWVRGLKRAISAALAAEGLQEKSLWQPGFFDHLLRKAESYLGKWNYVSQNPVRARLVSDGDLWPFQGEVTRIDRP
jgi:REP element-mobilizing transposase RayT